jgi:hypothetical protein
MMQANEYDESAKPYVLPSTDGLSISLLPGSVGKRFKYDRDGNKKNLWRRKGSVVTGPLGLDYRSRVPGTKALPSFKIIVSGTNPLWLPKRQDKAIAVAGPKKFVPRWSSLSRTTMLAPGTPSPPSPTIAAIAEVV